MPLTRVGRVCNHKRNNEGQVEDNKVLAVGASRYCIHVSMKNTPNYETNFHHPLIVQVDVLTVYVLLPHPIGLPELRVEICIYRVDA